MAGGLHATSISTGGGGVSAGAPFSAYHYPIIILNAPPTIANGRLAQLADAEQSIVAPGVAIGANSFVLGPRAIDAVGGDGSILLGLDITQNSGGAGMAVRQILIGNTINMGALSINCSDLIVIGYNPTFSVAGVQPDKQFSVLIGNVIIADTPNQFEPFRDNVLIGYGANGSGGNLTAVGAAARTWTSGTAIGSNSQAAHYSVAIGDTAQQADTGLGDNAGVVIGYRAKVGDGSIGIGKESGYQSILTKSIHIGWQAGALNSGQTAAVTNVILLGREAVCNVNDTFLVGSAPWPIPRFTFGAGDTVDGTVVGTTGQTFIIENTYVVGGANNQPGNSLVVRPGTGTGNWANAQNLGLDFQVGAVQAAGVARQTPTSVLALHHSDLNVALWGGLAATFGGGAKVLFVGNAGTVPTVAPVGGGIAYATGGELHWLSSAGVDSTLTPPAAAALPYPLAAPAVPNANNAEFAGAGLGGFAVLVDVVAPNTRDTNANANSRLVAHISNNANDAVLLTQTLSGVWTGDISVTIEASIGKIRSSFVGIDFGFLAAGLNSGFIARIDASSGDLALADYSNWTTNTSAALVAGTNIFPLTDNFPGAQGYYHLQRVAGTWSIWVSRDGASWVEVGTNGSALAVVGGAVGIRGFGSTAPYTAAVDFVRYNWLFLP